LGARGVEETSRRWRPRRTATLAAVLSGELSLAAEDRVCAVVCGAGTAGLSPKGVGLTA
jgi:hypothetical protein